MEKEQVYSFIWPDSCSARRAQRLRNATGRYENCHQRYFPWIQNSKYFWISYCTTLFKVNSLQARQMTCDGQLPLLLPFCEVSSFVAKVSPRKQMPNLGPPCSNITLEAKKQSNTVSFHKSDLTLLMDWYSTEFWMESLAGIWRPRHWFCFRRFTVWLTFSSSDHTETSSRRWLERFLHRRLF